jgi:hypothetical protein
VFSLIPKENTTVSKLARYFKTEPTVIVPFSFGIRENTVFSNVFDSYHLVDERYIKDYGVPHGILRVSNRSTISLFPEHSTLV